MIDWSQGMEQDFEFYRVDESTWLNAERLDTVVGCDIVRDLSSEGVESATLQIDGDYMGEQWVRCYMACKQGGERHMECLGTFLVQSPSRKFDGAVSTLECKAYSALHPLREALVPMGTWLPAGANCVGSVAEMFGEHGVAPVVHGGSPALLMGNYAAAPGSTWLEHGRAVASMAGNVVGVTPEGRVEIRQDSPTAALMPVWEFSDGDGSVLYPEAEETFDWYGLPNACEVVATWGKTTVSARAVNDDPASILSVGNRGREVTLRIEEPQELAGGATEAECEALARIKLQEASCIVRKLRIAYAYRPIPLGACVRLSYDAAGIGGDAVITRQEMRLESGLKVEAECTVKQQLWRY